MQIQICMYMHSSDGIQIHVESVESILLIVESDFCGRKYLRLLYIYPLAFDKSISSIFTPSFFSRLSRDSKIPDEIKVLFSVTSCSLNVFAKFRILWYFFFFDEYFGILIISLV